MGKADRLGPLDPRETGDSMRRCALAAVIGLALAVVPAGAQPVSPPPPPANPSGPAVEPHLNTVTFATLYRLEEEAGVEWLASASCPRPVATTEDLRGTLRVGPDPNWTPTVQAWIVTEVNWFHTDGDVAARRVTGSGTYTRTVLPGAPATHRLILDLRVEDEGPQRYDSGVQAYGGQDPGPMPHFDLRVMPEGNACSSRTFRVAAGVAPKSAIRRYNAHGTRYFEGCFAPCACPVVLDLEVRGSFDLVDVGVSNGFQAFAVTSARFLSPMPPPPGHLELFAKGYGIYRVGMPGAHPVLQEEMVLDVFINGLPGRIRAPFEDVADPFPAIEIDLSEFGQVCYDRVLRLSAEPR